MMLFNQAVSLIQLLHSETGKYQIAAGVAAGFVLGMTPVFSMQTLLIFLCILLFRIQFGMAMISAALFKLIAFALDPIFDSVGLWVLRLQALKPAFTWMYNAPIIPYTRFNNSIVMGSGIVSILLSPFVFFFASYLVEKYRVTIVAKAKQTRLAKWIAYSKFYQWYQSASKLKQKVS